MYVCMYIYIYIYLDPEDGTPCYSETLMSIDMTTRLAILAILESHVKFIDLLKSMWGY